MGFKATRIGLITLVGLKIGTMGISEMPPIVGSPTWEAVAYGIETAVDTTAEGIGRRKEEEENAEAEQDGSVTTSGEPPPNPDEDEDLENSMLENETPGEYSEDQLNWLNEEYQDAGYNQDQIDTLGEMQLLHFNSHGETMADLADDIDTSQTTSDQPVVENSENQDNTINP